MIFKAQLRMRKCWVRKKIISATDVKAIEQGLAEILQEIEAGQFEWLLDLEDVHLNIEKAPDRYNWRRR